MPLKTYPILPQGPPKASVIAWVGIVALLLWLPMGCSRDATGKAKAEDPRKKWPCR